MASVAGPVVVAHHIQESTRPSEVSSLDLRGVQQEVTECIRKLFNTGRVERGYLDGGRGSYSEFSLDRFPHFRFKVELSDSVDCSLRKRLRNIVRASEVCREHHLCMLLIPMAAFFHVNVGGRNATVLVEQRMKQIYHERITSSGLWRDNRQKIIRQLAVFILHTGYSDVVASNMRLISARHYCQIALIHFDEMSSTRVGLYGDRHLGRFGLVGLFGLEALGIIQSEVKKLERLDIPDFIKVECFKGFPESRVQLISLATELCIHLRREQALNHAIRPMPPILIDPSRIDSPFYKSDAPIQKYPKGSSIALVILELTKLHFIRNAQQVAGQGWNIYLNLSQ